MIGFASSSGLATTVEDGHAGRWRWGRNWAQFDTGFTRYTSVFQGFFAENIDVTGKKLKLEVSCSVGWGEHVYGTFMTILDDQEDKSETGHKYDLTYSIDDEPATTNPTSSYSGSFGFAPSIDAVSLFNKKLLHVSIKVDDGRTISANFSLDFAERALHTIKQECLDKRH